MPATNVQSEASDDAPKHSSRPQISYFRLVSNFFLKSKPVSAPPSSPVSESFDAAPERSPASDPDAIIASLLLAFPALETDSPVRIWEPEDVLLEDSYDPTADASIPVDPIWTSLPINTAESADTSSLSTSTASSAPSISTEGRARRASQTDDSKAAASSTARPTQPPPPKPATKPIQKKAVPVKADQAGAELSMYGSDSRGECDHYENIRLTERYPKEVLPPAFREIFPEEQALLLIAENNIVDDELPTIDRDDVVLDKFGFPLFESASKHSLRSFKYQKSQNMKLLRWGRFRRQCQSDLHIESPIEDAPLGMGKWRSTGEVGRALSSRFTKLICQGVPIELRAEVWKEAIETRLLSSTTDLQSYLSNAEETLTHDVLREIEFDVSRTLTQSNPYFFDGKAVGSKRLRTILRAYAAWNPETGYCQGMNKIVAYILLTVPDVPSAFYIFSAMMDAVMPPRYWTDSMALASADQHVLKSLLAVFVPKVYQHLQAMNTFMVPFTLRWFVSLFTDGLHNTSAEFVYRVWDVILTQLYPVGYNYLLAVSVAIFRENEGIILAARSTMELHDVIAGKLGVREDRIDAVLTMADQLQFSNRGIDILRTSAREQLAMGAANPEGDIPGLGPLRELLAKSGGRFSDFTRLVGIPREKDRLA